MATTKNLRSGTGDKEIEKTSAPTFNVQLLDEVKIDPKALKFLQQEESKQKNT